MLTLLRSLLLSVLVGLPVAQAPSESAFTREFGPPGALGSFRARFAKDGAGLVFLQATDHYVTYADARKERHTGDDWLTLVYNGNDHALRLLHPMPSTAFLADPALERWEVDSTPDAVKFTFDGKAGLVLEKLLRHDPAQRGFVLEIALRNVSSTATGTLDFTLGAPMPVTPTESSLFGTLAVAVAAGQDGVPTTVPPKAGPPQLLAMPERLSFAGSTNRFFGAFLWPRDEATRASMQGMMVDTVPGQELADLHVKPFSSTRIQHALRLAVPAAGGETRLSFGLYIGPKSYRVFATLPEPGRFAPVLEFDLKAPCCMIDMPGGRPMAKLLLWLLGIFHDVVGNWGIAIIMLTILVRGLLAPLNFRMQKSMRAYGARMNVLKPKMDALKKQYGDDQRAYQQAMVQFQRENKLMPPLGGCLPIFLTMPIYIGLFTALRTAYDLRQQPFCLWVDDLSRPDALFVLPFWPGDLNLLPIAWIVLMVIQTLRTPLPTDPQQRQTMMIMRYMPLIFGVMLYTYASGLLVYMVTSMLWSLVEMTITKRILGPIDPNAAAFAPQTM